MSDEKRTVEKSKDDDGVTRVSSTRDDGGSVHHTTSVDIPGVGSLRASYDEDKSTGQYSGAHFSDNNKKR